MSSSKFAFTLILISVIILITLTFVFNGTGDDGDSVFHYLLAHTAFQRPEHYFDHWAKPVFVLLASPFAYFGFTSMKIFNVICLSVTLIMTYKIAEALKIKNAWLTTLIIMCCPYVLSQSLSGLTEPLFSAFLSIGLYLIIKKKLVSALIFLSFLPFVRSEGLIILSVLCIYLVFIQQWKLIPLLIIGHIVYGLLGLIYYDSPLWVFKSIPYAHLSTPYGKGDWFHFYTNMPMVLGKGLNIVWNIGMVLGLFRLFKYLQNHKNEKFFFAKDELWLVYGMFTAFFLGHTAFWALGIFWSMGLMRVLIGVMPLIAIICLFGFNLIIDLISNYNSKYFKPALFTISTFCLFFLYKSSSKYVFELSPSQVIQQRIANTFGKKWAVQNPKPVLYFNTPYLGMLLQSDFDYFDESKHKRAIQLYDGSPLPYYMYYIWDRSYAFYEGGGPASKAFSDKRLKLIKTETEYDPYYGESKEFHIFIRDTGVEMKLKGQIYSFKNDKNWATNKTDTNRIITLNKTNPYSPGYNEYLKLLNEGKSNKEIKVSFKVKADRLPKTDWENAKFVFSIQNNGKDINWKGIPIQQRMTLENQWESLEFKEVLPVNASPDDKINIYIWNDNVINVMIKDFKIELFE